MKFLIILLSVVGMSLQQNRKIIYEFKNIERYWTTCLKNSVLYTPNQSEPSQKITIKKDIDAEHQLLISAEVTNLNTGKKVYHGEYVKICVNDLWGEENWNLFAVRLFRVGIFPKDGTSTCPVHPGQYNIYRKVHDMVMKLPEKLSNGRYEISYIVKSYDNEIVFSPLKFRFNVSPLL